jgi:hypothetical protein
MDLLFPKKCKVELNLPSDHLYTSCTMPKYSEYTTANVLPETYSIDFQ